MNANTGQIYENVSPERIVEETYNTLEGLDIKTRKNWMRDHPCVCGSGKKFKKCCWRKYAGRKK